MRRYETQQGPRYEAHLESLGESRSFETQRGALDYILRRHRERNLPVRNLLWDCGTHLECELPGGRRFKFDTQDLALVQSLVVGYNAGHAIVRQAGQRRHLSTLMLQETATRVVTHRNGDLLDLRRANLALDYPAKRRGGLQRNNTSGCGGVTERQQVLRNGTLQTRFVVQWYAARTGEEKKRLCSRTFTYHGAEDRERARQEAITFRSMLNM